MSGNIDLDKRKWLSLGGIAIGVSCLPMKVLSAINNPSSKIIKFYNINTHERLVSKFWNGGSFIPYEMSKINNLMRDRRTNSVTQMDPYVFVKLYKIQQMLGAIHKEVKVICGYRTAKTNAARHLQSRAVARNSQHVLGKAIDINISGSNIRQIYNASLALNDGGSGYYPYNDFVHIDTGPTRHWVS